MDGHGLRCASVCAGPEMCSPFRVSTRVSCAYISVCVCVHLVGFEGCQDVIGNNGPRETSEGRKPRSYHRLFLSFLPPPLFEIFEARIRGNFFEKLSLFVSRILFEIDHFQKKRKSSNYHFVQPGNRIILLVNFTIEEEESNLINLIIDSEERITFDQNWNRNIRPRI